MLSILIVATLQLSSAIMPEAESLGRRLASLSGIATIAPQMIENDLQDLSNEDKSLSATERARLMTLGQDEERRSLDRLITALGHAYSSRLSVSDLRRLVSDAESPAAAHRRAIETAAIMETMATLGGMDIKKSVASNFCRETAKLCHR